MLYNRQKPENARAYGAVNGVLAPGASITENFKAYEFQCSDDTPVWLVHPTLVLLLQEIRSHFNRVCIINSGFRTHAYNDRLPNSASTSKHLLGMAADIAVSGVDPDEVATFAEKKGAGGVGRYNTFTHVDVWGKNRRWDYR